MVFSPQCSLYQNWARVTVVNSQSIVTMFCKYLAIWAFSVVGTGWGVSPSTLHTSLCPSTCVCTSWILRPNMEQKQAHQPLDVSLNCTLRIITGCLQLTPVEQLPVLTGIPPEELRRRAASLALACRAMDPDHLFHHTITREETQPRLKPGAPLPQAEKIW